MRIITAVIYVLNQKQSSKTAGCFIECAWACGNRSNQKQNRDKLNIFVHYLNTCGNKNDETKNELLQVIQVANEYQKFHYSISYLSNKIH